MHVDVIGFERSGVISNTQVLEFISKAFPKNALKRIQRIEYVHTYKSTMQDQDGFDSIFTKGLYVASAHWTNNSTGLDIAEIYRQDPVNENDKDFLLHCIAHEIGHSVYASMPPERRREWRLLSENTSAKEFITQRALADEVEDFCETFAIYCLDRKKLEQSSKRKTNLIDSVLNA
jgi:hypothetical protein